MRNLMMAAVAAGCAAVAAIPAVTTASADGYYPETRRARSCMHHTEARYLLSLVGTDRLRPEVEERYARAVRSAKSSVASGSPRFIWSTEAKVACAKVIGYLNYPLRRKATRESLQKCECFSSRMSAAGG